MVVTRNKKAAISVSQFETELQGYRAGKDFKDHSVDSSMFRLD